MVTLPDMGVIMEIQIAWYMVIRKENFKKFREKQGIISWPENVQEVLPIPTQARARNLKPGDSAAAFLTLPIGD